MEVDEGSEAEATISVAMKDRAPFVKTGNSRIWEKGFGARRNAHILEFRAKRSIKCCNCNRFCRNAPIIGG